MLYFTAYHLQTDEQSERINQTVEVALRYYLQTLDKPELWPQVLSTLQTDLNNTLSAFTEKMSNEIIYSFTSNQSADLLLIKSVSLTTRVEAKNVIFLAMMMSKNSYDRKHQIKFFYSEDYILLQLHCRYSIFSVKKKGKKLSEQYMRSFKVLKRVERLVYRLNISQH